MSLSFKEVEQILRIVEEFPATEVRFEYGDLKLHVRRQGASPGAQEVAAVTAAAKPASVSQPAASPADQPAPAAAPVIKASAAPPEQREGLVPVLAPMMGVYYAAPAPDAPPYVQVGQQVVEGTDLCIIEVMKVMNMVKSPCDGTVVDIIATNGAMVERDSAMLWIRPGSRS